jgi:hypothetical protein
LFQLFQSPPTASAWNRGDWSTFFWPDFWVTVAGITFRDSSGALAWCRSQGRDSDHRAAKIASTTRDIEQKYRLQLIGDQNDKKFALLSQIAVLLGRFDTL